MKHAHLTYDAVFRPGLPSPTSLYSSIVRRLIRSANTLLIVNAHNNSAGGDLTARAFGIKEVRPSREFDHASLDGKVYRDGQVNMSPSGNLRTGRTVTAARISGVRRSTGFFSDHAWAYAAPGARTTTASACAIHSAGANGGSS